MTTALLRSSQLLAWLLVVMLALGATQPVQASHLLGGEMTYRYLGATGPATAPHRYEITVAVYNNCASSVLGTEAPVAIYDLATGVKIPLTTTNYAIVNGGNMSIPETSLDACVTPTVPPGCTIVGASQSYRLQRFVGIVNLPATTQGFYAFWTAYARNIDITNLYDPGNQNMSLYCTLAPPALANSSPVFVEKAVANLCANDTTYILNNAVDADGDQLVYSFGQPYGATMPTSFSSLPTQLTYNAGFGYTGTTPLGTAAGNYSSINATTGIAKFRTNATLNDKFAVAIDVQEYRIINGQRVLIGTTRRDVQLVVVTCPGTVAPVLPTATPTNPTPRAYTVETGSTLTIPLVATQADGHPLTMSVSSVLLDGAGGYNATFGGSPGTLTAGNPSGTAATPSIVSPVAGTFVYTAGCNDARSNPYDVTLLVKDNGCAGKTVGDVLRITVVKPTAPTAIAGNLAVCGPNTVQSYTASGGSAPTVSWTVTGGTIVGSSTANPVQVRWATAGTGTLAVQGVTQYGCLTEQLTKTVVVSPAATLTLAGSQRICQGGSTTLTVTGGAAPYTFTGGATPISGAGPFVLSPTQTTTYTVASTASGSTCPATSQVTITVDPVPVANAGAAVVICAGGTAQLGAAPVAGSTYSWSPITGLSNGNVANPTVTLPNSTGGPLTQTYTLTETSATGSCSASNSVTVTVVPPPVATPGVAVAICSGSSAQLGAAPVAGLTYRWSPIFGLSDATVANPTVTLTNTTGAPTSQTYTLTVTGGGCFSTSAVTVTVNPLPAANAGAPVSFCSGNSAQLGAAPVAGYTYSWSPAAGLSDATVANPTVTLTNSTGAPISQAYTLTVSGASATCPSTATVTVTVAPIPVAAPGPALTICSGGTGQLGAAPVAGLAYSWSPTTGLSDPTIANPTVTLTTTGAASTQAYTLTVANATGCTSTGTVAVTVNPQLVANAGAAVSFCSGGTGQLGAAPGAGLTYSWSPISGLSNPTIANPTVTLTNTTSATLNQLYTLTVAAAQGCSATSTVVATVSPQIVANAGAPISLCSGGTGQLGAAPVAGLTYSWSPTAGLSNPAIANPAVTLTNTTGAVIGQTYTLTVARANCSATSAVAVTVAPLLMATPGPAITICSGASAQLGAAPVAGLTYSWSPTTGLSDAAVANPTVTLTNPAGAAATQTYTLTITTSAACASTGTVAVTVNPAVVPGVIGADQTVCAGAVPAPLTSTAAASGGLGSYVYQWESSPDNSTWKAIANASGLDYTPGPVAATRYFRRRVTTGACGMAYTNVVTVQTQSLLIPTVALPPLPAQCAGSTLTFTPAPANAGAAPTYRWFINGKLIGAGPAYTSATLADGDQIQVELTPTAGFCASGTAIATARVSFTPVPPPTLAIVLHTALPVCVGAPISFSLDRATNLGASPQYQWQVDGVNVAGATSPRFVCATLRDGQTVALVVHTATACGQPATATSNAVRVAVNPPVHVAAGPDKTIMEGESVELEGTADGSYPVTWTAAPSLTFAGGNQLHPVAAPTVTTTYVLSAGAGHCADQSTVTVTVLRRLRIPNAFTPNGDNNDDTWQIEHIEDYPGSHIAVFNRWGSKVFEASGYSRSNEWNGTINGQPAPIGTYYYLVTLGNGKSFSGPLTVLY